MAKDIKAVIVKMRRYILDGMRPTQAAKLAGISERSFYNYRENNAEFAEAIIDAEAQLEHLWLKKIKKIGVDTKNAQALIKLMEARFSDRWNPTNKTELTGANGQSVVFKVDASGGYIPPNNVLGIPSTLTTTTLPTLTAKDVDKAEPS